MQESMGSQSMIQDLNRVGAVAAERLLEAQPLSRWARDVQRLSSQVSGHLWTLVPYGTASVSTLPLMGGEPYRNHVNDPQRGPVPILGQLYRSHENQGRLVILLHGLASTPSDPYLRRMVRALRALNCDVLSIALRGSLGKGTDHYHAGLTDDICAIFADPRLSRYESICLAGYSLGGQIALRYALDHASPRLKGTVALCAPIDMRPCQIALDSPGLTPYRMSILTALKWTYHRLAWNARRCGQAMSCTSARFVRSILLRMGRERRLLQIRLPVCRSLLPGGVRGPAPRPNDHTDPAGLRCGRSHRTSGSHRAISKGGFAGGRRGVTRLPTPYFPGI